MPGAYLWAWNSVKSEFVKVKADASGYLVVKEEMGQAQIDPDTNEYQTWDAELNSLLNNLNRIRSQIIAITGEAWGTVTNPLTDYTLKAAVLAAINASTEADKIDNAQLDDIAWAKVTKAGSSLADLITRSAGDLNSGILAAARYSSTVVAAIAGLDPTFTSITMDGNEIKRDVISDRLTLRGGSADNGAYMHMYGGDYAAAALKGVCQVYIGDHRAGKTPNSYFGIEYRSDGGSTPIFKVDIAGNIITVARGDFSAGVRLGTAQDANHFDDSSHGSASTDMYIGNKKITAAFTAAHYYQLGDVDLEVGELVKVINHKIYRSNKLRDKAVCGIYWGVTDYKDSFGNVLLKNAEIDEEYDDENDLEEVTRSEAIEEVKEKVRIKAGKKKELIENKKTKKLEIIEVPDFVEVETGAFVERLKPLVSLDEKTGMFMKQKCKVKKAITNNPIRVSDGQPATPMDFAYAVAVLGDSFEDHDKNPLPGAWVTIGAGIMEEGDFLCSSLQAGYLEKQGDNVRYDYTKAIAREKITADTKNAYVELI